MKRKFIVLSGSARFLKAWSDWRLKVVLSGHIPYTILADWRERADSGQIKARLDENYQAVIAEYADELIVLNVGGYIGPSTEAEIAVAKQKGIPITYIEKTPAPAHAQSVTPK